LECQVTEMDNIKRIAVESHLIVNTTSIGMDEEQSVIDYEHISKNAIVYDIVYKPVITNLLENARYAGADVVYGYEMLLEQGARAFEIWTDLQAPRDVMKRSLLGDFKEPV
jgi:shikimate dehydrogenase